MCQFKFFTELYFLSEFIFNKNLRLIRKLKEKKERKINKKKHTHILGIKGSHLYKLRI